MRAAGSLIVIAFVFVLLFPADAVLISRALLFPNLPCAGRGIGSTDLSVLGGRAFRVRTSSSHLIFRKMGWWAYLNELRGVVVVETATAVG